MACGAGGHRRGRRRHGIVARAAHRRRPQRLHRRSGAGQCAGARPARGSLSADGRRIRGALSARQALQRQRHRVLAAARAPPRAYAFSADAIHGGAAYSRRVTGSDFSDPVWLRLGAINEGYNWTGGNELQRNKREPRWKLLHPWRLDMPYFVMVRMPAGIHRQPAVLAGAAAVGEGCRALRAVAKHRARLPHGRSRRHGPDDLRRGDLRLRCGCSLEPTWAVRLRGLTEAGACVGGGACRPAAARPLAAAADGAADRR